MQTSDYPAAERLAFWAGVTSKFVYFIQSGDGGPVKIGHTKDPLKRLAALQTGSPTRLHLRDVVPGDYALEAALHRRFGAAHITGEWFGDEWTAIILIYAHGLAQSAIDAYDGFGSPPILTGAEFRTAKEVVELRADIERMRLMGFTDEQICGYAKLDEDELENQLMAMRRTKIYDLRFRIGPGRARWTKWTAMAEHSDRRDDQAGKVWSDSRQRWEGSYGEMLAQDRMDLEIEAERLEDEAA